MCLVVLCLCACNIRQRNIELSAKESIIRDSLIAITRKDSIKFKPPTETRPFSFDFVLKEPVLATNNNKGETTDEPLKIDVRVASDTVKRVLLVYFDRSLKYDFTELKYYHNLDGFEQIIESGNGTILKIFGTHDDEVRDQISIYTPDGIIYATGTFITSASQRKR